MTGDKPTSRELRKRQRDALRSKATGRGLQIDTSSSSDNKNRILFDDEIPTPPAGDNREEEVVDVLKEPAKAQDTGPDSDSDDDDAVEEVHGSAARKEAEMALENEAAAFQPAKKKRKKKSIFDESFFAQVEKAQREQQQLQDEKEKTRDEAFPRQNHRTTFVVSGEQTIEDISASGGQNIQVVVLSENGDVVSSGLSETAKVYSRSHLIDRSDGKDSTTTRHPKKKNRIKPSNWKRSSQTNIRLLGTHNFGKKKKSSAPEYVFEM